MWLSRVENNWEFVLKSCCVNKKVAVNWPIFLLLLQHRFFIYGLFVTGVCTLSSVLWHCWLGGRKGILPVKKGDGGGGHCLVHMEWRPSGWSCVSASVNLCFHHTVQKFSSGTGSSGWSRKKGHKMVVVWWWWYVGCSTDRDLLPVLTWRAMCVRVYIRTYIHTSH